MLLKLSFSLRLPYVRYVLVNNHEILQLFMFINTTISDVQVSQHRIETGLQSDHSLSQKISCSP